MAECFRANYPDTCIVLDATRVVHRNSYLSGLAVAALSFLQEPHNAEGLDWYFPEWLNLLLSVSCGVGPSAIVSW